MQGLGGEGGALFKKKHSQETKDKLAEISRRQKLSEETKLKISALHKGRKNSEETIEKMKIARQKVVAEKKIKK